MAKYSKVVLTQQGKVLLTRTQMGECDLVLTRAGTGDAIHEAGEDLTTLTQLGNEVQSFPVSIYKRNGSNIKMCFVATNFIPENGSGLTEEYYIQEIGIFARASDEDTEILYAVTMATEAVHMPAYDEASPTTATFNINSYVGSDTNVVIEESSAAYVPMAIYSEQIENINKSLSNKVDTVDSVLSSTSTNPVQNKVVNEALNGKYSIKVATTDIPENADLDTYIIPGEYNCPDGATAKTISNTPYTNTGFKLRVEYISYAGHIKQTVIGVSSNGERFRTSANGGTSFQGGWKKVVNDSDVIPIAQGGTGATTGAEALGNLGITVTAAELNKLGEKATTETGTFTLTHSGSTVMTGTYEKIGKFVYLRASSTPKVAVPASSTLSGLPFTVTSGNNSFFRLAKSTAYPLDGGVANVSGTSFVTGVALDTSSPTVFTAMYITSS